MVEFQAFIIAGLVIQSLTLAAAGYAAWSAARVERFLIKLIHEAKQARRR